MKIELHSKTALQRSEEEAGDFTCSPLNCSFNESINPIIWRMFLTFCIISFCTFLVLDVYFDANNSMTFNASGQLIYSYWRSNWDCGPRQWWTKVKPKTTNHSRSHLWPCRSCRGWSPPRPGRCKNEPPQNVCRGRRCTASSWVLLPRHDCWDWQRSEKQQRSGRPHPHPHVFIFRTFAVSTLLRRFRAIKRRHLETLLIPFQLENSGLCFSLDGQK